MSKFKRLFSVLIVMAIVFGFVESSAYAVERENEKYDIVVSKIKMENLDGWPKNHGSDDIKDGYTGNKISNIKEYFGGDSVKIKGAYFEVHENTAEGKIVAEGITEEDESIKFEGLSKGKYVITENKSKSKYNDNGNEVANSVAVPMEVQLPVYKEDGSKYTTGENALHVYPKCTVSKPGIEKFVSENKFADTALLGEKKIFTIESTMPEGIADYKVLNYVDNMSKGLNYEGNLKVQLNNSVLKESEDYTVNITPKDEEGNEIKISIKKERIRTLKAGQKIKISYEASINSSAVMGKANENKALVQYTVNSKGEAIKENKITEIPEIHTGGIRFIKVDGLDGKSIEGAKFIVLNSDKSKALLKEENGKLSWTSKEKATKFESGKDGIFEIKGLPYGVLGNKNNEGETSYFIEEVEAPKGYAKLTEVYEFKINATSYYSNLKELKLKEPEKIKNNKITIPQTGGNGAVKIVAAGFSIAVIGLLIKNKLLNN